MAGAKYDYIVELLTLDGDSLQQSRISNPDWLPAMEAARFEALRRGKPVTRDERVEPTWHPNGRPSVTGVTTIVTTEDGEDVSATIPIQYFQPHAQRIASALVDLNVLREGEEFLYRMKAVPANMPETLAAKGFGVAARISKFPVRCERPISDVQGAIDACIGYGNQPFPVYIPRQVLDAADRLKDEANGLETGGVLIGHLFTDTATKVPWTLITALIPARHTVQASTKLTFTPETWSSVRSEINARNADEVYAGWLHTHPAKAWNAATPNSDESAVPLSGEFFSSDDLLVQRTCFSGATQVGVVLSDKLDPHSGVWETTYSAFGWSCGTIQSRSLYVLAGDIPCSPTKQGDEIA